MFNIHVIYSVVDAQCAVCTHQGSHRRLKRIQKKSYIQIFHLMSNAQIPVPNAHIPELNLIQKLANEIEKYVVKQEK